ncbi:hypothetical protein SDC9_171683 [bioreactor metagenome]|uniref:Uncharacterized protein n=1 Tax=bioreactor metagenome TaxID=1076179 RepID=A0A645GBJ1_9ZZZZ
MEQLPLMCIDKANEIETRQGNRLVRQRGQFHIVPQQATRYSGDGEMAGAIKLQT